jgi:hypothetical protein
MMANPLKINPKIIMGVVKLTKVVNNKDIKRENQIFIFLNPF